MNETSTPRLLLERMQDWATVPYGTLTQARHQEDRSWWEVHTETVNWLADFETRLDDRAMEMYVGIQEKLWNAVFCPGLQWDVDNGDTTLLGSGDLAALGFAVQNVEMRDRLLAETPERQAVFDSLLLIRGLLMDDADLGEEAKQYLLVLVGRVEELLAEVAVKGEADVRAAADQLIGALTRLFVDRDGEQSQNASNAVKRFAKTVGDFLNSPLVAAVAGGVAGSLFQLTMGQ